jgi:purine-binding chemotaxis protein CheW
MTAEAPTEADAQAFVSRITRLKGGLAANNGIADAESTDEFSVILFEVGGSPFALPTLSVTEVVRVAEIVEIPRAPAFIEGVIEIRDEVIPVIDLGKKLGFRRIERTAWTIVVAVVGGKKTGFIVEQAKKVLALTMSELQSLGSVVSGPESRYIFRTVNRDGQPIVILNVDTLLNDEELASLSEVDGGKQA